jgi:two-component system sensor histidine kinase YesM
VKRIPYDTLYRNSTRLTTITAAIALATMLIVIIGTLLISIRITSPIRKLAGYMKQIQAGNMDVEIDVQSRDEIGLLARSFRQMMDRINNLILKEYRLELANKTSQLKMLQAQINPHFLYNSLQSIGTLALQHNAPRVYKLLSSLANLMRYSMRNNESMVRLRQEIEHLNRFLDLQQERFGEQFRFTTDADEESLEAYVPKMILQPLAENYFKHGMHPDYGIGELQLSSRLSPDGRLTVEMRNNGAPVPEERLAELRGRLAEGCEPSGNEEEPIGLLNVLMRLKLYTDDTAELRIENLKPHGVKVMLSFPATIAPAKGDLS